MLVAYLLAAALAAEPTPVLKVVLEAGDPRLSNTARGLADLLGEDLRQLPDVHVRSDAEVADPANAGKLRGATQLVTVQVMKLGEISVSVRVIGVLDQKTLGAARVTVKGGAWNLARVDLATGVAKALKVPLPPGYAVENATAEQLEAWGAALALVEAKDPKAKAAVQEIVRRWPDFTPAGRLLLRL